MKKIYLIILFVTLCINLFPSNNDNRINFKKKDGYNFAKTEYFEIYSSLKRSETRRILKYLTLFSEKFIQIFSISTPIKNIPAIRIFEERKEYFKYVKTNNIKSAKYGGGFYSPRDNSIVVFYKGQTEETVRTLIHELSHYFVNHNFKNIPQAINEGFSTYFESAGFKFHRLKFGSLETSRYNDFLALVKKRKFISLPVFLRIKGYNLGQINETFGTYQYAQAWALIWYLLHSNDKNRHFFKTYLDHVKINHDPNGMALIKILSKDPNFEKRWLLHMTDPSIKSKTIKNLDL